MALAQTPIPAPTLTHTPMPSSTPIPSPISVAPQPPAPPVDAFISSPPPAPTPQPTPSAIDASVEITQAPPSSVATQIPSAIPTPPHTNSPTPVTNNQSITSEMSSSVRTPQDPPSDKQAIGRSIARVVDSALDLDPLHLIRKVCHRFHAVARQLRLRRDYRPTLEVDDDYDLQDLLCALLKVEFDEVATEEWTPPYTGGTPRTTLLVNRDQIAVVTKKTRSGLTTKELADQLAADSAYYRAQGRCSTLF